MIAGWPQHAVTAMMIEMRPAAECRAAAWRFASPEAGRGEMTGAVEQISSLLHEAGETHHRVFRIVDGADDDWASWYAQWLIDLSELPDLLGRQAGQSAANHLANARHEVAWRRAGLLDDASPNAPPAFVVAQIAGPLVIEEFLSSRPKQIGIIPRIEPCR